METTNATFGTVKQVATQRVEQGQWPDTEQALRRLIFNNPQGFNERCTRRVGRRVLVNNVELDAWLGEQESVA
jgi:hypothetical protein